jgi:hypothetical protein
MHGLGSRKKAIRKLTRAPKTNVSQELSNTPTLAPKRPLIED